MIITKTQAIVTKNADEFDREKIDLIKRTVAQDATDDELDLFIYQAKRTGLDPLSRQLHFVKRNRKKFVNNQWIEEGVATIQTGIDGYRTIAARTGEYAGNDDAIYDSETEKYPIKATVTVYRMIKGERVGFTASARWSEYCPVYNGKPSSMWEKMPYLMLAKCAEALALRKAFPQELSGVYTTEEMSQADSPTIPVTHPKIESQQETIEEKATEVDLDDKCQYCGTVGKYHKKGCPSAEQAKEEVVVASPAS